MDKGDSNYVVFYIYFSYRFVNNDQVCDKIIINVTNKTSHFVKKKKKKELRYGALGVWGGFV